MVFLLQCHLRKRCAQQDVVCGQLGMGNKVNEQHIIETLQNRSVAGELGRTSIAGLKWVHKAFVYKRMCLRIYACTYIQMYMCIAYMAKKYVRCGVEMWGGMGASCLFLRITKTNEDAKRSSYKNSSVCMRNAETNTYICLYVLYKRIWLFQAVKCIYRLNSNNQRLFALLFWFLFSYFIYLNLAMATCYRYFKNAIVNYCDVVASVTYRMNTIIYLQLIIIIQFRIKNVN